MYRQLAEARRLADGIPDVLARIDEMEDVPFSETDILALLASGVEAHPLLELTVDPADYEDDLLPAGFDAGPARGEPSWGRSPLYLYLWTLTFRNLSAGIRFLNIPAYVTLSPDELLLPRSVVEHF